MVTKDAKPRTTCNDSCTPELLILDSISGKWAVQIIHRLSETSLRNGELQRKVTGISQKVLTQTLRRLEKDGIVNRQVFPVVPPEVEYSLSELGQSLVGILDQLSTWSVQHFPTVQKARSEYESRVG